MFRIVFVCTGNRCRSPLAEARLRALAQGLPIEVDSVGLLDVGPAPALPEMLEVARSSGLDLSPHRARALANVDLSNADLVIGLERSHVAAAVVEGNVAYEKAFTLKEVVRLLEQIEPGDEADDEQRARAAVARAHERRAGDASFIPGEDIEDPFGGPRLGYVDMAQEVSELCRRLLAHLMGSRGRVSGQPSTR